MTSFTFAYKPHLIMLAVVFFNTPHETVSHGRLMQPPNRSSIWRVPKFCRYNPPVNYNDNELYCADAHQTENPGTECGVCGDPLIDPVPRPNEVGGKFYKGIITGRYRIGQIIEVVVEFTMTHKGFMEWRLCTDHQNETQDCFNENLLIQADGSGSQVEVTNVGLYKANLTLPANVTCSHCVIQWNYRAGNDYGMCTNGTGAVGCGPQETFRGCSDISILPNVIIKKKKNYKKHNDTRRRKHKIIFKPSPLYFV